MVSNRGDNVTFTCSSQGGPNNTFQWMRNAQLLDSEREGVLVLTDITGTDGGVYTCVVSNAAGNDFDISTLYIRPYFTTEPVTEIFTSDDQNVSFVCEADGFPIPTVVWERVNASLGMNMQVATGSSLSFMPVQFGDEGNYQCVVNATIPGEIDQILSPDSLSTLYGELHSYDMTCVYCTCVFFFIGSVSQWKRRCLS